MGWIRVALTTSMLVSTASADDEVLTTSDALDDASTVRADPDEPGLAFGFRGGLRATAAGRAVLVDEGPFRVSFDGLLETYNPDAENAAPYEFWRGRVALRVGYTWTEEAAAYRLFAELSHESDHESVTTFRRPRFGTFLYENQLRAGGALFALTGPVAWTATATLAFGLIDCTNAEVECDRFEFAGSQSASGMIDLVVELPHPGSAEMREAWVGYVSIALSGMIGGDHIETEAAVRALIGVRHALAAGGVLRAWVGFYGGNEIGMHHGVGVARFDAGIGWAL
jgi:hypothetical protein